MKLIPRHEKKKTTVRVLSVATVKIPRFLKLFRVEISQFRSAKKSHIVNIINLFSDLMIYKHSNCILHRSESDNNTLLSMFV